MLKTVGRESRGLKEEIWREDFGAREAASLRRVEIGTAAEMGGGAMRARYARPLGALDWSGEALRCFDEYCICFCTALFCITFPSAEVSTLTRCFVCRVSSPPWLTFSHCEAHVLLLRRAPPLSVLSVPS